VNLVDLLVVVVVAVSALAGWRRGLVAQLVSFSGVLLGAIIGGRVGPLLLSEGSESAWVPLASLIGALCGALVLQFATSALGTSMRSRIIPSRFRTADSAGGLATGALVGVGVMWLIAVLALQQPAVGLRSQVEGSLMLTRLVDRVPARSVLAALESLDPLPLLSGIPHATLPEPDLSVIDIRQARSVRSSVVEIVGTSCGIRAQGSGWVAGDNIIVTNAHVVAGQRDTRVLTPGQQDLGADLVYLDIENDVAILHVPRLDAPVLQVADATKHGETVVMLGYPRGGPLRADYATAGRATKVIAPNALNRGRGFRTVVPLRGRVEPGESGGPIVNADGRVMSMVFGATEEGGGSVGVPLSAIRTALDANFRPVAPGGCIR
jgi:S1-C subfamily serine protease